MLAFSAFVISEYQVEAARLVIDGNQRVSELPARSIRLRTIAEVGSSGTPPYVGVPAEVSRRMGWQSATVTR
jgi:hypothetical protein